MRNTELHMFYVYVVCVFDVFAVLVPGFMWAVRDTGESCLSRRKSLSAAFSSQTLLISTEELNNTFPGILYT